MNKSAQYKNDSVIQYMERHRVPVTRESYLAACYPCDGDMPDEIDEESLPPELRLTDDEEL